MINNDFYPTPKPLAERMIAKIKGHPSKILEPSAGAGDLIIGNPPFAECNKHLLKAIDIMNRDGYWATEGKT
jgi:hypothetical protein